MTRMILRHIILYSINHCFSKGSSIPVFTRKRVYSTYETIEHHLVGDEGVNVSKLVVDHEAKKTHHGGTALVELDGTLLKLGFFIKSVPAEVKGTVAEVTGEFGFSSNVLHDGQFQETNEGKNLEGTGNRDGEGSIPARSEVRELGSVVGDFTGEVDTGLVDQVSNNTKHADTSVLDFNVTKAIELFLVAIGNKAKGIEETKRRLGSKFVLEGLQGGGGSSLLGRSEGGGGGKEGGDNSELHLVSFLEQSKLCLLHVT